MEISMTYRANDESDAFLEDVVRRAREGDREAFGVIFERNHRFVYKFVFAMAGDHERAEEITQETFLGAYRGIASLRGESSIRTWLCGIAKNLVYKSFRDLTPMSAIEIETDEFAAAAGDSPDKQFLNKELNQTIADALGRLSPDRRMIFVLREMQHLSYREIAEITGNAIPKLKTDLFRAKVEMRAALRPYLEAKG